MRILLTNDDGIDAPGIEALYDAIQTMGDVVTVAPATVQSAAGHGITYREPLMVEEVVVNDRMTGIAVDGRPADCVKVGLRSIWPERFGAGSRPDLTISGMNSGANVGINVIYSGTVAAAVESAFLGVPAIAVSLFLDNRARTSYRRASEIARVAIDQVLGSAGGMLDDHTVLNMNIPVTETADAPQPPIRTAPMNTAAGSDGYERRESPHGRAYYWPNGNTMQFTHTAAKSDVELLREGAITLTPLSYDLTDHQRLQQWAERVDPTRV